MNKIELFIFDMDGLMFDTGRLSYRGYFNSAEKHDYELNHNVYYYLTGKTDPDIRLGMKELYGEEVPYNEWRDSMNVFKNELLAKEKTVHKKYGLVPLLDFAKEQGVKIAVASSSNREKVSTYLEMEGLTDYFDVLLAGDEVEAGKPNPEIFLKASQKAGVDPAHALVFEDSRVGIEAARRAGILSVLVEDDITDLPVRKGRYPLKKDLSRLRERPAPADFQFHDLLQARNFLAKKELFL
ncbi:HAD family phosphatase [Enterococcus thailandicus]|uniref:HAD family hydrolase n=1 Tax=Enterococcus thailandicus TaxID=417368 RepID=UPI0022EBBC81|nr:HAD family phosphatase [Enterococcus thailandicus]MDA3973875.1 HAD family phosphatase [Enterococcus thailandicus]MDA3976312.1 HAD family phosphatase [Enterococcus thailandicus]MDA3981277.1 HAD family phosphatase [Enterococcus thailandicus]